MTCKGSVASSALSLIGLFSNHFAQQKLQWGGRSATEVLSLCWGSPGFKPFWPNLIPSCPVQALERSQRSPAEFCSSLEKGRVANTLSLFLLLESSFHWPLRLVDGVSPQGHQAGSTSILFAAPWSECNMTLASGLQFCSFVTSVA